MVERRYGAGDIIIEKDGVVGLQVVFPEMSCTWRSRSIDRPASAVKLLR